MSSILKERTVSVDDDYMVKGIDHTYYVYYLTPNGYEKSSNYDSFQKAFDKAIAFANCVKGYDELDDKKKLNILNSIHIMDDLEEADVTTAELKNKIRDIMNS